MPKISDELREERREAIRQAALRCLAGSGYAGTNMRTIAEAAGLTKGGLYAYYDSKEAIFLDVAERYMQEQLSGSEPLEGETPEAHLARVLAAYEQPEPTPETARAQKAIFDLWTFAGEIPAVRGALERRYDRYLSSLSKVIAHGQATRAFRQDADPQQVAGLVLAARTGMVFEAVKLGAPVPVPQLTRLLTDMVRSYLLLGP